jgi:hypothetical protein
VLQRALCQRPGQAGPQLPDDPSLNLLAVAVQQAGIAQQRGDVL